MEASGDHLDPLAAVDEAKERAKHLRAEGVERLRDYAQAILAKRHAERLVIFVDQFEELFTLAGHERADTEADGEVSVQPDFRDLMAGTATLTGMPKIQWLYALRGDFADRAFKHRVFRDAVGDGNVFLGDMNEAELRDAVERPAAKLNVRFEGPTADQPGLVKRIVAAASRTQTGAGGERTQPALPLMQHVLAELWKGMRDRVLTHEAYDQLGELEGALDRHAEAVFAQLTKEEQGQTRRLFSRLLNVEENGEVTRRVASREDLGEELWSLALRLAGEGNRLLTVRGAASASTGGGQESDTLAASATAEVAHEALLRHWKRLQEWVGEDQQFYRWRRRFEGQMRDNPHLSAGGPLETAVGWLEMRPHDLDQRQQDYIEASQQKHRQDLEEKEAQRRKLATALRGVRRYAFVASVIAVIAILAALGAGWFWNQANRQTGIAQEAALRADEAAKKQEELRKEAERQQIIVEDDASRFLASIAEGLLAQGRTLQAIKVARLGIPREFSSEELRRKPAAFAALSQDLAKLESDPALLVGHEGALTVRRSRPTGRGSSRLRATRPRGYGTRRAAECLRRCKGTPCWSRAATFSPDGTRIVTASWDKTARLWDVASGRLLATLEGHSRCGHGRSFSPDGKRIVTGSNDKTARLWDAATGRLLATLEGHSDVVTAGSFSPDGKRIVTASNDKTARLWDAANGGLLVTLQGHAGPHSRVVLARRDADCHGIIRQHRAAVGRGKRPIACDAAGAHCWRNSRIVLARWDADRHGIVTIQPRGCGMRQRACARGPGGAHRFGQSRIVLARRDADHHGIDDKTARLWDAASGHLLATLEGHTDSVQRHRSRPTGRGSSRHRSTRPRGCGTWQTAGRSRRCRGTPMRSSPHRSRPTGRGSSRHRMTTPRGCGTRRTGVCSRRCRGTPVRSRRIVLARRDADRHGIERQHRAAVGRGERGLIALCRGTPVGSQPHRSRPTGRGSSRRPTTRPRGCGTRQAGIGSRRCRGIQKRFSAASFSPDGTRIVTASFDKTARLWDAASGRLLATLRGHTGAVTPHRSRPTGRGSSRLRPTRPRGCGTRRAAGRSRRCRDTPMRSRPHRSRPTGRGLSRRRPTRPRGCGTRQTGVPSQPCRGTPVG